MALLTEQERQEVAEQIAEVEKNTAGEVVVAVVDRSNDYMGTRTLVSGCFALGSGALLDYIYPVLSGTYLLLLTVAVMVGLAAALGRAHKLLRFFVRPEHIDAAVENQAFATFSRHGVHQTREQSGLLIYISELEHRVVILADRGVNQRFGGNEVWQDYVKRLSAACRNNNLATTLDKVLIELGERLAAEFPQRKDDRNELPNEVLG